jgi:FAD/FMN-containing dehydrogenase
MRALAYGSGRSYGDVALNPAGLLINCRSLDRFIDFDRETGILTCEAGVRLADILALLCRPNAVGGGWFPPVSPSTRFVTVGGAIANDVHGKNHHRFGTFGRHVLSLDLARSDGSVRECSPDREPELFAATIGGLGLTGLILRARLQLRWVNGTAVESEEVRFDELAEFFVLSAESDSDWEYTAAFLDCLQPMGRGIGLGQERRRRHWAPRHEVPFDLPFSPIPLPPKGAVVAHINDGGIGSQGKCFYCKMSVGNSTGVPLQTGYTDCRTDPKQSNICSHGPACVSGVFGGEYIAPRDQV